MLVERGIELFGPVGEGALVAVANREQGVEVGPGAGNGRFLFLFAGVHETGFEHLAGFAFPPLFFFSFQPGEGGGAGLGQWFAQCLLPVLAQLI